MPTWRHVSLQQLIEENDTSMHDSLDVLFADETRLIFRTALLEQLMLEVETSQDELPFGGE